MTARTLYDKIWDDHLVDQAEDGTCLLYIDRHLVHEVTSPQAFEGLRMTGRKVRAPEKTIAVPDHNVPTTLDRANAATMTEDSRIQVDALDKNAKDFGINYYPVSDVRQGIVHIVGPEQGWTLPGMTVVCGDSAYRDPWCVRVVGAWHRHVRGGTCAGHANADPAQGQEFQGGDHRAICAPASPPRTSPCR